MTNDTIEKVKAANPGADLRVIANQELGIEVIVRAPNKAEFRRFRTMYGDPAQRAIASEAFLLGCIAEPTAEEFRATLDRYPALAESFAGELCEIAGAIGTVTNRKL